jgi:hypothetical protein
MLFRLVESIDKDGVAVPVTLLDAIHMAAISWEEVTPISVRTASGRQGF